MDSERMLDLWYGKPQPRQIKHGNESHPYSEFGSPEDVGFTAERFAQIREMARPRESEA